MHSLLADAAASPGLTTVVAVLSVVILFLGGGGAIAWFRTMRATALRSALIDIIIADEKTEGSLKWTYAKMRAEFLAEMSALRAEIAVLKKEVTPNGGNTNRLGDRIVTMQKSLESTDAKVVAYTSKLDEHIGHADAVEREVFRRVGQLERT